MRTISANLTTDSESGSFSSDLAARIASARLAVALDLLLDSVLLEGGSEGEAERLDDGLETRAAAADWAAVVSSMSMRWQSSRMS